MCDVLIQDAFRLAILFSVVGFAALLMAYALVVAVVRYTAQFKEWLYG